MPEFLKSITIPQADGSPIEVVVNDNSDVLASLQSVRNDTAALKASIGSQTTALNNHAAESTAFHNEIEEMINLNTILTSLSILANKEGAKLWMGTYKEYLEQDRSVSGGYTLYVIY